MDSGGVAGSAACSWARDGVAAPKTMTTEKIFNINLIMKLHSSLMAFTGVALLHKYRKEALVHHFEYINPYVIRDGLLSGSVTAVMLNLLMVS